MYPKRQPVIPTAMAVAKDDPDLYTSTSEPAHAEGISTPSVPKTIDSSSRLGGLESSKSPLALVARIEMTESCLAGNISRSLAPELEAAAKKRMESLRLYNASRMA